MQRKMLAAILLPLPFAALPVAVVMISAVFGPGGNDEVVLRETPTAIEREYVSSEAPAIDAAALASIASPAQFEPGCADHDLLSES